MYILKSEALSAIPELSLPVNFILDGQRIGEGRHEPLRAGDKQRVQPKPPQAGVDQLSPQ